MKGNNNKHRGSDAMKRLLLAVLLGLLALPAAGREYQSEFGFTLQASDDWLALTP